APDRVHARARVDPRRHDPAGRHARRPVPRRPRQPRPGPRAGDPAHRAAQPKELRRSPVHKVLAPALALTLAAASAHARTDAAAQPIAPGVAPVAPSANASVIGAPIIILPTWFWPYFVTSKCQFWDGTACTSADMANPYFKQILILPSGFADSERADFWSEFGKIRKHMATAGNVWSTQYRRKILWVGYFVPGGPLNTPTANFGAAVLEHPVRGYALSLSQDQVRAKVSAIKATSLPNLNPLGVGVLFNSFQDHITANASPPGLTRTPDALATL